jgi:hypothetical protein
MPRDEEQLDDAILELNVFLEWSPKSALFLAGQAFEGYRRAGGARAGVLPDLFIGAHAQVARRSSPAISAVIEHTFPPRN